MKFFPKKTIHSIVFIAGILLSHSLFLQNRDASSSVVLSSESNTTTNYYSDDPEINEDDQLLCETIILSFSIIEYQPVHYQVSCRLTHPFSVWQPPKTC